MKIENSTVNLYAKSSDKEQLRYRKSETKYGKVQNKATSGEDNLKNEFINDIKKQLEPLNQTMEGIQNKQITNNDDENWKMSDRDFEQLTLLEELLSKLTGKKIRFLKPESYSIDDSKYDPFVHQAISFGGVNITHEEIAFEKSSTFQFDASGSVTTSDGRNIDFELNIQESRNLSFNYSRTTVQGSMVDPLVINFNGELPKLTDKKYSFDIDFDGKEDQISFLTKGSGFLAFDSNNDGIINDGSELFGPKSGSGFADLAEYDQDNNGWIDENDDIFNGLRIWMKDEDGNDQLFALGEKGIGAIYLGAAASHFDLLGEDYKRDGRIKESGVYLDENGKAGSVHHVDLQL